MAQVCQAGVPLKINLQGRLTDRAGNSKAPGRYTIVAKFYAAATSGTVQWTSAPVPVDVVENGIFNAEFSGGTPPLDQLDFVTYSYYLELDITAPDGATETIPSPLSSDNPRRAILPSPYAFSAKNVSGVENYVYASNTSRVPITGYGGPSYAVVGIAPTMYQPGVTGDGTIGVIGKGVIAGITGESTTGYGIYGRGARGVTGVDYGTSVGDETDYGVGGWSTYGNGVFGRSDSTNPYKAGVYGFNSAGRAVTGVTRNGYGICGTMEPTSSLGAAGRFAGGVQIARGWGSFLEFNKTDTITPHVWRLYTRSPTDPNPGQLEFAYADGPDVSQWGVMTLLPDGRVGLGMGAAGTPKSDTRLTIDGGTEPYALYLDGSLKIKGELQTYTAASTYNSTTRSIIISPSAFKKAGTFKITGVSTYTINEVVIDFPTTVNLDKMVAVVNCPNNMVWPYLVEPRQLNIIPDGSFRGDASGNLYVHYFFVDIETP